MNLLLKLLVIAWYSLVLSFENARAQRAFDGDKYNKMRTSRAHSLFVSRVHKREKTRLIFRVENAHAQRAFPLASWSHFDCFVMLVCL